MRTKELLVGVFVAVIATVGASCSRKPAVVVPPVPLDDSGAAALRWVDERALAIESDSTHTSDARAAWGPIAGTGARILGVSELTEGTHEFPVVMRHMILTLARDFGYRGVAIQAPMAEAMELDRYVRIGVGDPKRLVRALGAVHWERQEVIALLDTLRNFNRGRVSSEQFGFYGFEAPSVRHAVQVVDSLPAGAITSSLKAWLANSLRCVAMGEGANWGREGLASDTTFWMACGRTAAAAADSLAVARKAAGTSATASLIAFAEQMARLISHQVVVGLRHLPRPEVVAEHVLFVKNELGEGKLVVWGRDYEAGRLELDRTIIQMAVPLTKKIGDQYRALAYAVGEGTIRAQPLAAGRDPGGERDLSLERPLAGTYENVFNRARLGAFVVDLRPLSNDAWLRGPHGMRVISGQYSPLLAGQLQHDMEFPRFYDGVVFVKRVRAVERMRK